MSKDTSYIEEDNPYSDIEVDDNTTSVETFSTIPVINVPSPRRGIALSPKKRPRKKRSVVWAEFLVTDKSITKDGKEIATCIHCKTASFICDSHYGTKNLLEHLKKCVLYKESLTNNGTTRDGLLMIRETVRNIRNSVKYVKYSEVRKKTFKSCVTLAAITETKALWLDVPTRWNSTYMMLDRAILYREAFKELKNKDTSYKYYPDSDEWDKLEKVRDVLEPFCDITNLFSGSEYPTSNLYFENVWRIAMHLKELAGCEDDVLRAMGNSMQDKFDKYWFHSDGDDYNTLFAFAVILDPRYKQQFLMYCYQTIFENDERADERASSEVDDVLFKLRRLLDEYKVKETNVSSQRSNIPTTKSSNPRRKFDLDAFDIVVESTCTTSQRSLTSLLDVYLDDKKLDRNIDLNILNFWKAHENKYHELAYLARDILSVPLTTVASESTFSIGGRILNKWRSCYLPDNIEALITSRSWLHGYDPGEEKEFTGSDVEWNVPA